MSRRWKLEGFHLGTHRNAFNVLFVVRFEEGTWEVGWLWAMLRSSAPARRGVSKQDFWEFQAWNLWLCHASTACGVDLFASCKPFDLEPPLPRPL